MRETRFTEEQIIGLLKQAEAGRPVAELCRQVGITDTTFYKWRSKFAGLEVSEARRLRQLEGKTRRWTSWCPKRCWAENDRARPSPPARDEELRKRLRELAEGRRRFGCPRLYLLLRREGLVVNHKRVEHLYREEALSLRLRPKRKRQSHLRVDQPAPIGPNGQWAMDFVSDSLGNGRRMKVLTIIDLWDRRCPRLEADSSIPGERVVRVLEQLRLRPVALAHGIREPGDVVLDVALKRHMECRGLGFCAGDEHAPVHFRFDLAGPLFGLDFGVEGLAGDGQAPLSDPGFPLGCSTLADGGH